MSEDKGPKKKLMNLGMFTIVHVSAGVDDNSEDEWRICAVDEDASLWLAASDERALELGALTIAFSRAQATSQHFVEVYGYKFEVVRAPVCSFSVTWEMGAHVSIPSRSDISALDAAVLDILDDVPIDDFEAEMNGSSFEVYNEDTWEELEE